MRRAEGKRGVAPLGVEGLFQALGQGLGETYLGAFALWLRAGPLLLGLTAAVPTAATALAQTVAHRMQGRRRSTKAFVVRTFWLQALGYAALGVCAFAPAGPGFGPWLLCGLALLTWGLSGITVPAWTGWVSTIVPRARWGAFFGLRGAAQQVGILTAILGGGALMYALGARGLEALGFLLLFLAAAAARAAGNLLFASVPDRPFTGPPASLAAGYAMLRRSGRFRRLALYLWGLHLAANVAVPFFVPYMIEDLGLGYAVMGALLAVPAVVKMLTLRAWGLVADRVGPGPLLRVTGWLVVPVSALWLLSGSPWWIVVAQVYSGIVWGGFEVAQAASILQTTRGRQEAVAFFNLVDGGMIVAGALAGGAIVRLLEAWQGIGYLGAIGVSSILRAVPAALLLWRVRGIGRPPWSHLLMPLRAWAVRPTRGLSVRPWALGEAPAEEDRAASHRAPDA